MNSLDKLSVKDFKFGIELELEVEIDDLVDEISLEDGWRAHDEHCGSEIVSPPLKGFSGLLSIRRQLKEIWRCFDRISFFDCGLHVHVDIQHFTLKHAKRLLMLGSIFDEVIYGMMDGSRYKNQYAHHCNYNIDDIKSCLTIADLQMLQEHDRYHGLNLYAFPKHGTVEFRYAMATADWAKVYSLVSMYLRMVAYAGSNMPISEPVVEIPTWNSIGPSFVAKKVNLLNQLKTQFFDLLQIGGNVRLVLNNLFKANILNTTNEHEPCELKKPVRGLRQQPIRIN